VRFPGSAAVFLFFLFAAIFQGFSQCSYVLPLSRSKFPVGAAVLTTEGKLHVGCNVENASFGLTICAERSALCAVVAAGDKSRVKAIICSTGGALHVLHESLTPASSV
jgi:cytidine deaminase